MDKIKFAVFTDLHYDHIPDSDRRLQGFINKIKRTDIDFVIELGDFCYPIEENRIILKELEKLGLPCYYVIGNHDSDAFTREQVMCFLGMKNSYYSFVKGNIKFIVLDTCYIRRRMDIPHIIREIMIKYQVVILIFHLNNYHG